MEYVAMRSRNLRLLVLAMAVSACTSSPTKAVGGGAGGGADKPVSQQTAPSGSPRQRAQIHTELGGLYLQDTRYHVALQEAQTAIASDPNYALAYNLLGTVQMYLAQPKAAEEAFKKALDIAPRDPEISNNYGWFLCSQRREAESLAFFETAYTNTLYQTPGKALTNAGICNLQIGKLSDAEKLFLIAVRIDGANTQALYGLADIFYRTKRYEEARSRLSDLEKMMEPTPQILWLALRTERALGDRAGEQRYATQLRRKFQDSAEYQALIKGQYD